MTVLTNRLLRLLFLIVLGLAGWALAQAWKRWGRPALNNRLDAFAQATELAVLAAMRANLTDLPPSRETQEGGMVAAAAVRRWCKAISVTLLWRSGLLLLVAVLTLLFAWNGSPEPSRATWLAPLRWLWHKVTGAPEAAVAFWRHPGAYLPSQWLMVSFLAMVTAWQVASRVLMARTGNENGFTSSPARQRRLEKEADAASLN
ncbi:hypothetical protein ACF07Y_45185 [Streptomyces sp. NPDC016566]|uniref:hypothetical protein n=1 Tax=Streptomyces sp. NPDC016566 TaxID=3364967 RepID=UPI0036F4C466